MMRFVFMNASRAKLMSDNRGLRWLQLLGAMSIGLVVLAAVYALPIAAPLQQADAGASVHAKNSDTPDWIIELQARNARQSPVTVENGEPSYWI
jgi:hypothetical protein